jgi:hypothetical protein
MADRVLTTRDLNRAVLARQLLLKRSPLSIPRALERVAGLQTQYAPSGYIGLWSRLLDFQRDALTTALEQRRVVQATLMRSTIHMVSAEDFPLFAAGVRKGRREWWARVTRNQVESRQMELAARLIRKRLSAGPARATELTDVLNEAGMPPVARNGVGLWVDMVRVPPSGTWKRRRADLYGLAADWLGTFRATESQGVLHLIGRYLAAFGPAPLSDIANWAGFVPAKVGPFVKRLELRRFRSAKGTELLDLPDAPLPDAETPAPIRFLPTWEATLLAHARRTLILPEKYRPLIFNTKMPQSVPTFLVDGSVAGTWRYEGGRVVVKPFAPLSRAIRRELDDEADRLAAFHAD